jgi:hypothetical protein
MFIKITFEESIFDFKSKLGKWFKKKRKKKIYHLSCDNCKNEFQRSSDNFSPKRANNNFSHFCAECGDTQGFAGKIGSISRKNIQTTLLGSKIIDSCGYISVYVGPNYKYTNTYGGRIREHIYLIQEKLGRQLDKNEVIHHIDGNKLNNNMNNLDLCTVQQHNNCHAKSEKIVFELFTKGLVGYNNVTKLYYLK